MNSLFLPWINSDIILDFFGKYTLCFTKEEFQLKFTMEILLGTNAE
jgi:hypothetical protein